MKELLIVSVGSFFGGGARYAVSKAVQGCVAGAFPLGTMTVNVLGCLIIGFLSGLQWTSGWMNPHTRLLLTTGFCGGFTTFSTFMQETSTLAKDGSTLISAAYVVASLALGFGAVVAGQQIAKWL